MPTVTETQPPSSPPNYKPFMTVLHTYSPAPLRTTNPCLIISDSLFAINSITNPIPTHPLSSQIHITLATLDSCSISVVFLWVPGHAGIIENENVDKLAKQASTYPKITATTLASSHDLFLFINHHIHTTWLPGKTTTPLTHSLN